jgi:chromate reductase, NAD(P)H dehydrogenase (quinone)
MDQTREPVRFLVFSASLRAGALNSRLAQLAADAIAANGGEVDLAAMDDFDAPSYDADVQEVEGFPAAAEELRDRIAASDAFVIASPEYNFSMPGSLKNAIDWVTVQPAAVQRATRAADLRVPVDGRRHSRAVGAASPAGHLGARVYPGMFSLAQAHHALDEDGQLIDACLGERFEQTIVAFMDLVEASKHYPCVKTKWVEYLGEHPDPAIDRVE